MLVVRVLPIIKNFVKRGQIPRICIEPALHVLMLDVDDGPVVADCGHLRLRLISYGGEGQQLFVGPISPGP